MSTPAAAATTWAKVRDMGRSPTVSDDNVPQKVTVRQAYIIGGIHGLALALMLIAPILAGFGFYGCMP
jgi:hypothetical protein